MAGVERLPLHQRGVGQHLLRDPDSLIQDCLIIALILYGQQFQRFAGAGNAVGDILRGQAFAADAHYYGSGHIRVCAQAYEDAQCHLVVRLEVDAGLVVEQGYDAATDIVCNTGRQAVGAFACGNQCHVVAYADGAVWSFVSQEFRDFRLL